MSFKLDSSKFKKIRADKQSTTMRHEDGHELTIHHAALSPKVRSQLISMPTAAPTKMADGGEVNQTPAPEQQKQAPVVVNVNSGPPQQQAPQEAPPPAAPDESLMHKIGGGLRSIVANSPPARALGLAQAAAPTVKAGLQDAIAGAAGMPSADMQAQVAQTEAPEQALTPPASPDIPTPIPNSPPAAPAPPSDPYGANATFGSYGKGITEGEKGIADAQKAAETLGKAQSTATQDAANAQQKLQTEWNTNSAKIKLDMDHALGELQKGTINPNHYLENMSTGSKIMTAIGMILGGIGGGANGNNPAVDFLNKQIEKDIEAQKANFGQKETVYSGFLKQYQNERDATDMTRIFQNQAYDLQLKKAANENISSAAKAAAEQASSTLHMNTAQLVGQMTMRKTLLGGVNQGSIPPEMLLRAGVVADMDHASFAKELGEAQELGKARDMTLSALQEVAKINTIGGRLTSPLQTSSRIRALKDPVVAALSKATAGRFTEQDAHMLDSLFSSMSDNAETNALKLRQADKLVSEKMVYPTLKSYNVDTSKFGRFAAPTGGAPQKRIQLGPPVK